MGRKTQKRRVGTGHLYPKHGSHYGRWRTLDGRLLNRKVGEIRTPGSREGLTDAQAEREFRKMQSEEERRPRPVRDADTATVDTAADSLRRKQKLEGARKSYQENCESMQRVHISPRLGSLPVTNVTRAHVEAVATAMLKKKLSSKTVRNTLSFLHSVFEHAIDEGWCHENPVRRATRPGRRRSGDVAPDLQFLTVEELDAVLRAIPDEVVFREPKPTRKGRRGPSPPPPPDVLGPVLRVVILAAAMTGLRQSELLGLRWRHVDWIAQRIRPRSTFVRGEHSEEGKSDLSTKRSVPMADRLARELDGWSKRTEFGAEDDLVFAHPQTGNALDRSKVTKRFKEACVEAKVRPIRFHDLRHTFATRLAGAGQPLRSIQEFMGHADSKTTQIYAHYAPSEHEVQMVNEAFAPKAEKEPEGVSGAERPKGDLEASGPNASSG
jgi:integrase